MEILASLAEPLPEASRLDSPQLGDARDPPLVKEPLGLPPDSRDDPAPPGAPPVSPSGLRKSDAIFATSLFGPMPIEQVRPSRSRISRLIRRACARARSRSPSEVRSTYASSMLAGWNASAPALTMAMMRRETPREEGGAVRAHTRAASAR